MSNIRNIFQGIQNYFSAQFTETDVKVAYKDERAEVNVQHPSITILLYDVNIDTSRRYGGIGRVIEEHPTENDTKRQIRNKPLPIDLHFQLDSICEKQSEDWDFAKRMFQIFSEQYTKIDIPGEESVYLIPTTINNLDTIEGNNFRKAYRFFVQIWFDSLAEAQEAYIVLSQKLNINDQDLVA